MRRQERLTGSLEDLGVSAQRGAASGAPAPSETGSKAAASARQLGRLAGQLSAARQGSGGGQTRVDSAAGQQQQASAYAEPYVGPYSGGVLFRDGDAPLQPASASSPSDLLPQGRATSPVGRLRPVRGPRQPAPVDVPALDARGTLRAGGSSPVVFRTDFVGELGGNSPGGESLTLPPSRGSPTLFRASAGEAPAESLASTEAEVWRQLGLDHDADGLLFAGGLMGAGPMGVAPRHVKEMIADRN